MKFIASGSSFYTFKVNGLPKSTHSQWHTAAGLAADHKLANPSDAVVISVQQEIRVEHTSSVPVPAPTPVPEPAPVPAPTNRAPQWIPVPAIMFTLGVAQRISIAAYANDPDGDALVFVKNIAGLPAGVTFDAVGKQFVYDGGGEAISTGGHILTASDGKP